MIEHVYMAGALQNLGNNLIAVVAGWSKPALEAIVGIIIFVKIIQRFSIKAGIGVALSAVLVLGLYNDRDQLSTAVTNELQSDTHGAALHSEVLVLPARPAAQVTGGRP